MIVDKISPVPKVVHRQVGKEMRKIRRLIYSFSKRMEGTAEQLVVAGKLPSWDDTPLKMRRLLVNVVKKEMLEKDGVEDKIALMACFVWFSRLEDDRKAEILDEWGR